MLLQEWIIYPSDYEEFFSLSMNKTTKWTSALKYQEAYFMDYSGQLLGCPTNLPALPVGLLTPNGRGCLWFRHTWIRNEYFWVSEVHWSLSPQPYGKCHSLYSSLKWCLLYDSLPILPYGRNFISKFQKLWIELIILLQTHCLIDRKHASKSSCMHGRSSYINLTMGGLLLFSIFMKF